MPRAVALSGRPPCRPSLRTITCRLDRPSIRVVESLPDMKNGSADIAQDLQSPRSVAHWGLAALLMLAILTQTASVAAAGATGLASLIAVHAAAPPGILGTYEHFIRRNFEGSMVGDVFEVAWRLVNAPVADPRVPFEKLMLQLLAESEEPGSQNAGAPALGSKTSYK